MTPLVDDPVVSVPAAVAAALVAYGIIYRKGIKPLLHFFHAIGRIADATPILVTMAEEFHPNGGGSLRDIVDRIEAKVDEAVVVAETTKTHLDARLEEHLRLPAWHRERDSVLARLTRLEAQIAEG